MTVVANEAEHVLVVASLSPEAARAMARNLHRAGSRRHSAFLCAVPPQGLPAMLLESELFGHSVNASSGAFRDFAGLLERVSDGTLLIERLDLFPRHIWIDWHRP
jgi:DNA-binding NtrC family response regulator